MCEGLGTDFSFPAKWAVCERHLSERRTKSVAGLHLVHPETPAACWVCRTRGRHRSHETQGDRCWPSGITEMVRGPQGNKPWTPYPSSVENLKDGNSLFFLCCFFEGGGIVYVCFPAHVTSDKIGPLVQSLKLCQKANSSPPWGLALNLPGLYMFCGTHKEAIGDSLRVSLKPASHAEKSWCFPLGLHAFLFVCEPFSFCF